MSKFILIQLTVQTLMIVMVRGQGTFIFSNISTPNGINARIFDAYGKPLDTNYYATLFGGRQAATLEQAFLFASGRLLSRTFIRTAPGYIDAELAYFPDIRPRELAWLQVRAWDGRLGGSYEAVRALGMGGYGESNLFQERASDVDSAGVPTFLTPLYGLKSFALLPVVPEPSSLWLLLLGSLSVFLGSWKKHKSCRDG